MINIQKLKKLISTHDISFVMDIHKSIYIEKNEKSMYVKIPTISIEKIENFILILEFDKIYILNPFITISCKDQDPVVALSRPFLISNNSNSKLIHEYLHNQFITFCKQFNVNIRSEYYLMFNYKKTELKRKDW